MLLQVLEHSSFIYSDPSMSFFVPSLSAMIGRGLRSLQGHPRGWPVPFTTHTYMELAENAFADNHLILSTGLK